MVQNYVDDTVAAIATPVGEGAIAVIRVSGSKAITALDRLFCGKIRLVEVPSSTAHFGKLCDLEGRVIDDVITLVFRKPKSYTGEDTVEVNCHGGMYITHKVYETILSTGVRQAEPGEFTKRAFLNGKLDLAQAEAVGDLIAAKSESSYRASMSQLEGRFSKEIKSIRSELLDLSSLLEVDLDFSEEGIELIAKTDLATKLRHLHSGLEKMIDTYNTGKRYREGIFVTIIGKPNVGKSSLFNALLAEERAIVSEIPGTTRDSLEESIMINGVLFRMHDTAGLRNTIDPIEIEGVSRSTKLISQSDLIIHVVDTVDLDYSSIPVSDERNVPTVIAYNKSDIIDYRDIGSTNNNESVVVSAKDGIGVDVLRNKMYRALFSNHVEIEQIQVTNSRHYISLAKAVSHIKQAEAAVQEAVPHEFISEDIRASSKCLSEIVGDISSDDTLNNIFSRFCIGK